MLDQSIPRSHVVFRIASVRVGCGERCGKASDDVSLKFYLNDVMMRQNGFLTSSVGKELNGDIFSADDTTVFSTERDE